MQTKHGADSSQVLVTLWGLCWKLPRTCHAGTLLTLHKEELNMNLVSATQTVWCSHHHHQQPPSGDHNFNTNSREQTVSNWRKTLLMLFSNEEEQKFSNLVAHVWKVQVQGVTFPTKTHAWSPYIIPEIKHKLWSPGGRGDLRMFACAWRNTWCHVIPCVRWSLGNDETSCAQPRSLWLESEGRGGVPTFAWAWAPSSNYVVGKTSTVPWNQRMLLTHLCSKPGATKSRGEIWISHFAFLVVQFTKHIFF